MNIMCCGKNVVFRNESFCVVYGDFYYCGIWKFFGFFESDFFLIV